MSLENLSDCDLDLLLEGPEIDFSGSDDPLRLLESSFSDEEIESQSVKPNFATISSKIFDFISFSMIVCLDF